MWKIVRGLLGLGLASALWATAKAEPWSVLADPDPQPVATFSPTALSEMRADGYWASGFAQNPADGSTSAAVGRFDANGNLQRWSFDGGFSKKLLADGGFVYASVRETEGPSTEFPRTFCMVVRVSADGRTQWQTVLDGRFCHAVEIDAAGEIWVGVSDNVIPDQSNFLNMDNITVAQVVRLHDDGRIAARIALDVPSQRVVEMRADPAGAGVFLAVHHVEPGKPQAVRIGVRRLRADGSVDWQWQSGKLAAASGNHALASGITQFRVSASAGIFAISSRFSSDPSIGNAKDWLAVGLSLAGVPRFDKTISFDNAVYVAGVSAPDAAGLWLVVAWGNRSDGAQGGKVAVARLSGAGKLGSSHRIDNAQDCICQLALRRDGGLWLSVFDRTAILVGVDAKGREHARLDGISQGPFDLLSDDRALVITGGSRSQPMRAVRVGFDQPNEPWPQLTLPVRRRLVSVEAVASDGGVVQWEELPSPDGNAITSALTFRSSDTAPVAWRIAFPFYGDIRLSVSRSMLCLSGMLRDSNIRDFVLQCRRRADGSVLWQDVRPLQPGEFINRFLDVTALDDGGAVAIRGVLGSVQHWLIGDDGQVLSEQTLPLLGSSQQELEITRANINTHGDTLLASFDSTKRDGILLRLDRDGQERFRTAFEGVFLTYGDITQDRLAFADDAGAIMYGSVITRYSANGEKLWELVPDRPIVDLLVDGDTIVYSMRSDDQFTFALVPGDWELVAVDSASGGERWRLPLGASFRQSASIAALAGRRLAVLQTETSHLRYRELDVATGTPLREQTDVCGGESCGCETNACRPRPLRPGAIARPTLSLQPAALGLRARLDTFQLGAGWGSSVLELADAGQDPATVRADQAGINGAWFAPWANGQGLVFDWIADARILFAPWFTFAPEGGNDPSGLRWYTLQGELADPSTGATLGIFSNESGRFGVGISAPRQVGSAELSFESCERAQFRYQFDPDENDGLRGLVTLSRLTPGLACSDAPGAPGAAVPAPPATVPNALDASLDGAWFDPANSGQGLTFTTIPASNPAEGILFAAWFTYDTEVAPDDPRQQHWFTLQGPLGSSDRTTLAIVRTTGGALLTQPTNNNQQVGTATVTRLGCDRLRLDYQFDDNDRAGPYRRISDFRELQRIGGCAH